MISVLRRTVCLWLKGAGMCLYTHTHGYLYVWMCVTPWMDRQMQLKPWLFLIFPFPWPSLLPVLPFTFLCSGCISPDDCLHTWCQPSHTAPSRLSTGPFQPNLGWFVHHIPQLLHKSLSFFSLLIPEHFFSCWIEPAVKVTITSLASCEDGSWHQSWCWARVTPPRAVVSPGEPVPRTGRRDSSSTPEPCHSFREPVGLGVEHHPRPEQWELIWVLPCSPLLSGQGWREQKGE